MNQERNQGDPDFSEVSINNKSAKQLLSNLSSEKTSLSGRFFLAQARLNRYTFYLPYVSTPLAIYEIGDCLRSGYPTPALINCFTSCLIG